MSKPKVTLCERFLRTLWVETEWPRNKIRPPTNLRYDNQSLWVDCCCHFCLLLKLEGIFLYFWLGRSAKKTRWKLVLRIWPASWHQTDKVQTINMETKSSSGWWFLHIFVVYTSVKSEMGSCVRGICFRWFLWSSLAWWLFISKTTTVTKPRKRKMSSTVKRKSATNNNTSSTTTTTLTKDVKIQSRVVNTSMTSVKEVSPTKKQRQTTASEQYQIEKSNVRSIYETNICVN